jgi:hypothetical protein
LLTPLVCAGGCFVFFRLIEEWFYTPWPSRYVPFTETFITVLVANIIWTALVCIGWPVRGVRARVYHPILV